MRSDLQITRLVFIISIIYLCSGYYSIHMQRKYKSASEESVFTSLELNISPLSKEASLFTIMKVKKIPWAPDYIVCSNGDVISFKRKNPQILKPSINEKGYSRVEINNKKYKVHRLIAELFVSNPCGLSEINHKDTNKLNNNVENIEWSTHKDNMIHAEKNNLINHPKGEQHGKSIFTISQVKQIRAMYIPYKVSQRKIAEIFNCSQGAIASILLKKTWQDI